MRLCTILSATVAVALLILPGHASFWSESDIRSITEAISRSTNLMPKKFGFLAYPRFVGIDVYGPLDLFFIVAFNTPNMTLSVVAETMDFVPAHITNPVSGPLSWLKPTYSFDDDPDIDVLFIPGKYVPPFSQEQPRRNVYSRLLLADRWTSRHHLHRRDH
jgi:hypothetical protein